MASSEPTPDRPADADPAPAGPRALLFRLAGQEERDGQRGAEESRDQLFACAVDAVREILRAHTVTRIPGAPDFVRGLTNLRGDVLTVLDLGMALDPARQPVHGGRIVVVESDGRRAGIVVDDVLEVREFAPDPALGRVGREAPQIPLPGPPDLVKPLGHLDGRIVFLLDVSALVDRALI